MFPITEESTLVRHRLFAAHGCIMALVGAFSDINNHENIAEVQFVLSSENIPDASQYRLGVVA